LEREKKSKGKPRETGGRKAVHPRIQDWQVARNKKFKQLTNTSQENGWFFL
jgi:hypothetical protein